jgi:uncharacterized Zn-binding protein involved in type VI secretion
MAQPIATIGHHHTCPAYDGDHPHIGGPALFGSQNVFVAGKSTCRLGDILQCNSPNPDTIIQGSAAVFINGLAAARVGDTTQHGGIIVEGNINVIIG